MTEANLGEQLWPYTERNSIGVAEDIDTLLADPEVTLTPAEVKKAEAYARGLFDGHVAGVETTASRSLEQLYRSSALAAQQLFYVPYFRSFDGQKRLAQLGLPAESEDAAIIARLHEIADVKQALSAKERKEIAKESQDWYVDKLSERLFDAEVPEDALLLEPVVVHYEPQKLLDHLDDLNQHRRFLREAYRQLKPQPDSHVKEAQIALLECQMGRVNNMVAGLYPHAALLARQIDNSQPGKTTDALAARLMQVVPMVSRAFKADRAERETYLSEWSSTFAVRMDRIRSGTSVLDGSLSQISPEALRMAARHKQQRGEREVPPEFSPEELAVMDNVVWRAPEMKTFNEAVLAKWGLLSVYTATEDEVAKRTGFAPDGKWQVVVHPNIDNMMIAGAKGVVFIPAKFERTLTQEAPAGSLPVSAHELSHVWQTEYNKILGLHLPLAAIRGRRYLTMYEAGGVGQEREFQGYFGRERHTNTAYLEALQAREAGGSFLDACRAFFGAYTAGRTLDAAEIGEASKTAIDRTLRLYRNGGYNSQPLDYLEQELIADALTALAANQRLIITIAAASLSLKDSRRLHRVGMFTLPTDVPPSPARTVYQVFRTHFLPGIMEVTTSSSLYTKT